MSTEIEVEISESGEVKIHVKGIKGKQCLSVTGELESLLGGVVDRSLTEEYGGSAITETEKKKIYE